FDRHPGGDPRRRTEERAASGQDQPRGRGRAGARQQGPARGGARLLHRPAHRDARIRRAAVRGRGRRLRRLGARARGVGTRGPGADPSRIEPQTHEAAGHGTGVRDRTFIETRAPARVTAAPPTEERTAARPMGGRRRTWGTASMRATYVDLITVPRTATPSAPPRSLVVSFTAEPTPARSGGRELMIDSVAGAIAMPMPSP